MEKHKNYELLNLLGYGLAKFDDAFIQQFGFHSKSDFYEYFVRLGIVETPSVVKNRRDLFDPFFENGRKGWWQRKQVYEPRKLLIDSLFGKEEVVGYANVVKLFLKEYYKITEITLQAKPIVKSQFRKMQETGWQAEWYFMQNYQQIPLFHKGVLQDARLYGDGYDFQIDVAEKSFLAEVKGIRQRTGDFRLTQKEFDKAQAYQEDYIVTLVIHMEATPELVTIANPIKQLKFEKESISVQEQVQYTFKFC